MACEKIFVHTLYVTESGSCNCSGAVRHFDAILAFIVGSYIFDLDPQTILSIVQELLHKQIIQSLDPVIVTLRIKKLLTCTLVFSGTN